MTTALVPYGRHPQSYPMVVTWARRKAGELPMPKMGPTRRLTHCWRGHRYIKRYGRNWCDSCHQIRMGRRSRLRLARKRLIAVGVKAQQQPNNITARAEFRRAIRALRAA